ncbi:MAG: 50S ribosomal protein L29 [Candidatus Woesearchaeota archaeon]
MKATKEFKTMNASQLKERLMDLRKELVKQNAQIATGTTPKSPGLIRQNKRNIARILTIMKQNQGGEDKK